MAYSNTLNYVVGDTLPELTVTLKDKNMTVYKHGGIDSEALAAEEEFLPSDDSRANTTSNSTSKQ